MKHLIIIILLIHLSYQINLEIVHISIPHQSNGIDGYYNFYLTLFSSSDIKSKISEMNNEDLSPFNFYIPDNCITQAIAVLVEEDPLTKDNYNYYIRIKYNITSQSIKLPNKFKGSNDYNITINKALIDQEYII